MSTIINFLPSCLSMFGAAFDRINKQWRQIMPDNIVPWLPVKALQKRGRYRLIGRQKIHGVNMGRRTPGGTGETNVDENQGKSQRHTRRARLHKHLRKEEELLLWYDITRKKKQSLKIVRMICKWNIQLCDSKNNVRRRFLSWFFSILPGNSRIERNSKVGNHSSLFVTRPGHGCCLLQCCMLTVEASQLRTNYRVSREDRVLLLIQGSV